LSDYERRGLKRGRGLRELLLLKEAGSGSTGTAKQSEAAGEWDGEKKEHKGTILREEKRV